MKIKNIKHIRFPLKEKNIYFSQINLFIYLLVLVKHARANRP